jgi:ATP-binding cassette, subfamily B, bacterial PglK
MYSSIRKLYTLFPREDKYRIILLMFLTLIGSLLEVVGVGAIPGFIATIAVPEKVVEIPIIKSITELLGISTSTELLVWGAGGLLLLFVVKNSYLSFLHYYKLKFLYNSNVKLSEKLYWKYLLAPYVFHIERHSSEILRNVKKETQNILNGVLVPMMNIVMRFIMLVGIFLMLLYIEPLLSVLTLIVFSFTGWLFLNFTKNKMKAYGIEALHHRKMITFNVMEALGGLKETKVLNREGYFFEKFSYNVVRMAVASRFQKYVSRLPALIIETITVLGLLGITIALVLQGREIALIIPILALFGMAAVRMMPAIKEIVSDYTNIQYTKFSIDPVYNDLALLKHQSNGIYRKRKIEREPIPFNDRIELRHVSYTYPNSKVEAIRSINLTIKKGDVIGFVGPTGAGKTTIVDVILGLLRPDNGSVYVDNFDIWDNLLGWQKNVGYIPQFIYLLDNTIKRNVAFGLRDEEIDEEKLFNGIKTAQLEDFVQSLPDKLETRVGERGVRLSGGQRQRIGIARALYNNPKVLIMDEATSALDNLTERFFIEALEQLRGDRTIIIIAHRLTTVKNCDRLYFMKNGIVEASGTYDELMDSTEEFKLMSLEE